MTTIQFYMTYNQVMLKAPIRLTKLSSGEPVKYSDEWLLSKSWYCKQPKTSMED